MPATPLPVVGDEVADPAFAAFASGERYEWGSDRAPVLEPPAAPLARPPVGAEPNALSDVPRNDSPGAPDASRAAAAGVTTATPSARRRARSTWWWIVALGGVGFATGTVGAALFAWQMGYDWRLAAQIGALGGVAGGALGVMLPAVARALGWAILATACGAVGGAALWVLTRVAPAFVERVLSMIP